jgi:hypothetical protein
LYDTGPAQDVALVRFINATGQPLTVTANGTAGGASTSSSSNTSNGIRIDPAHPIAAFQQAPSDRPISGNLEQAQQRTPVTLTLHAGGTASVVGWRDAHGQLASTRLNEDASHFDPLHASLAFYTVDPACHQADLVSVPHQVSVFAHQAPATVARRTINPVTLTVQALCDGQAAGAPLALGALQSGQRYSVFLIPSPSGRRLIGAQDSIAR